MERRDGGGWLKVAAVEASRSEMARAAIPWRNPTEDADLLRREAAVAHRCELSNGRIDTRVFDLPRGLAPAR